MSHTTCVSAVSSSLWSPRRPRPTCAARSTRSFHIFPVSSCPAASGLQIGLQNRLLACGSRLFQRGATSALHCRALYSRSETCERSALSPPAAARGSFAGVRLELLPPPFPTWESGATLGHCPACYLLDSASSPVAVGCWSGGRWLSAEGWGAWLSPVVLVMVPGGGCLFLILLSCGTSRWGGRTWPRWNGRFLRAGM